MAKLCQHSGQSQITEWLPHKKILIPNWSLLPLRTFCLTSLFHPYRTSLGHTTVTARHQKTNNCQNTDGKDIKHEQHIFDKYQKNYNKQWYTVWVKKSPPPRGVMTFLIFFTNGREFLIDFLHTYYTLQSTLDYKFLFNYPRFWRSYAILSATNKFT